MDERRAYPWRVIGNIEINVGRDITAWSKCALSSLSGGASFGGCVRAKNRLIYRTEVRESLRNVKRRRWNYNRRGLRLRDYTYRNQVFS
jgi:hypothetical protein